MYGWAGKILWVDLSKGEIYPVELRPDVARVYLGGRGLAAKIASDANPSCDDPFHPSNNLIFAAGALCGTFAPGSSRYTTAAISPATGIFASPNSGGSFAPEMKYSGYDAIAVAGSAGEPVYLEISDSGAAIRDAGELWGKTTGETDGLLRAKLGGQWRSACIGPGGEKLVSFACIINDKFRAAGRSGLGAVMGAKKLKAVAIKGSGSINVKDGSRFKNVCLDIIEKLRRKMAQNGSSIEGFTACFGCPWPCGKEQQIYGGAGKNREKETERGELWNLGAICGLNDLEARAAAYKLCNDLGIDAVSAGAAVSCAMELLRHGLLKEAQPGLKSCTDDATAALRLIEMVGRREGFGDTMAQGSWALAHCFGADDLFAPMAKGFVLSESDDPLEKQKLRAVCDSAGLCGLIHLEWYNISRLLEAATGVSFSSETLMGHYDLIAGMEKGINLKVGRSGRGDYLPKSVLNRIGARSLG